MKFTIYFVGVDKEDALGNLPFDSYESAESYLNDNPGMTIYSAYANVDTSTMEEADD